MKKWFRTSEGYQSEKWEKASLNEIYNKIERIRRENETIEKAKRLIENRDNKVRKFEADKEIAIAALDREFNSRNNQIDRDIESLKAQIKALETEKNGLTEKKQDKLSVIENGYKASIAKYDAEVEEYQEYADKELQSYSELQQEASHTEEMKSHVNEYKRMVNLQGDIEELQEESETLTRKIEKARYLPGEILETATIPIKGLTVENGIPLINGLPISNLSDGENLIYD